MKRIKKQERKNNLGTKVLNLLLITLLLFTTILVVTSNLKLVHAEDCDPLDPDCGDDPDPCPGGVCPPHPPIVDHNPTLTLIEAPSCAEPNSNVEVFVSATDDHRVSKLYLYSGTNLLGVYNCPYNFGTCSHTFTVQVSGSICNNYPLRARARDNIRQYSSYKYTSIFINDYPSVSLTGPSSVFVNEQFNLTAQATDSCGLSSLEIHGWPVKNCHGSTSCELTVHQTEHSAGTYNYGAVATDSYCGWTNSTSITVYVEEQQIPPEAILHANIIQGYAPLSILFDSSFSYDLDGFIVQHCIDYDDGLSYCQSAPILEWHNFTQPGVYNVTLTVTDDDGLSDTDNVIIIVEEKPNHCPTFTQSTYHFQGFEGQLLTINFSDYASDADNDSLLYNISNLPDGAYLDAVTGVFSWTPNYDQAGNYSMNISVSDGKCEDSSTVFIEIVDVNRIPWVDNVFITPHPARTTQDLYCNYDFHDLDNDPDHSVIRWYRNGVLTSYSTQVFPSSETQKGDILVCEVTPYDGKDYGIAVNSSASVIENTCPEFTSDEISVTYLEGEAALINFSTLVSDPDNDPLVFTSSELPDGAYLDAVTGVFSWTPDYDQAGNYTITITVSDGECSDTITLYIEVLNVGLNPEAVMNFTPASGCAPLTVHFDGTQSYDPDGFIVSYEWDFDDTHFGHGNTIDHTYTTPGAYYPRLRVVDNDGYSDSIVAQDPIVVLDCNQKPNVTIEALQPNNKCAPPGGFVYLYVTGTDDQEVSRLYLYKGAELVGNYTCSPNTGYCEHTFSVQVSDSEPCTFDTFIAIAEDNKHKLSEEANTTIMLTPPPTLNFESNETSVDINESFTLSADAFAYCGLETLSIQGLAEQDCNGSSSCSLSIHHSEPYVGSYNYTAEVVNSYCEEHYYKSVVVHVNLPDEPPTVSAIYEPIVSPNTTTYITIIGEDDYDVKTLYLYDDSHSLIGSYNCVGIQNYCSFDFEVEVPNEDCTSLTLYANVEDNASQFSDQLQIVISVDSPPKVSIIAIPQNVVVNQPFTIRVNATDNCGINSLHLFNTNLSVYLEKDCHGSLNCELELNTSEDETGTFRFYGRVIDTSSQIATVFTDVIVEELNHIPWVDDVFITPHPARTTQDLYCNYDFHDLDNDPDHSVIRWYRNGVLTSYSTQVFPSSETQKGDVLVCEVLPFDGKDYGVPVNASGVIIENTCPELSLIPNQTVVEGETLQIVLNAYDADNDTLTYYVVNPPENSNLTGNVFTWKPSFEDSGNYNITFTVSDGECSDSQTVFISVVESGNHPPRFITTPLTEAVVGEEYSYDSEAVDPDHDILLYYLTEFPTGMTINSSNGLITWIPTKTGYYDVRLGVTDGRGGFDFQDYTILVKPKSKEKIPRRKIHIDELSIIHNDCIEPGQDIVALIDFKNLGFYDMKNVRITAVIQELGLRTRLGPFRVDNGDEVSKILIMQLPEDTPEGIYDVRFTINDDLVRRVRYRDIVVKHNCEVPCCNKNSKV